MSTQRIVFVAGLSGSGKTTVKNAFDDLGFYTIDNLPIPLLEDFLGLIQQTSEEIQNVALVTDNRLGEYFEKLPGMIDALQAGGYAVTVLFLDASDEILLRRYSETRRKHPMSPSSSPADGIAQERKILEPIRKLADEIIDTSKLTVHNLKSRVTDLFSDKPLSEQLTVQITSFGFRNGLPHDADLVFDVRFLPNPFFREDLRDLTGHDKAVSDYVLSSSQCQALTSYLEKFLLFLLPLYRDEGKSYLNIAIGCTGGKHRSVAITDAMETFLKEKWGQGVRAVHRDTPKPTD